MVSDERAIQHLSPTLGSSLIASSATKNGPLKVFIYPRSTTVDLTHLKFESRSKTTRSTLAILRELRREPASG